MKTIYLLEQPTGGVMAHKAAKTIEGLKTIVTDYVKIYYGIKEKDTITIDIFNQEKAVVSEYFYKGKIERLVFSYQEVPIID